MCEHLVNLLPDLIKHQAFGAHAPDFPNIVQEVEEEKHPRWQLSRFVHILEQLFYSAVDCQLHGAKYPAQHKWRIHDFNQLVTTTV